MTSYRIEDSILYRFGGLHLFSRQSPALSCASLTKRPDIGSGRMIAFARDVDYPGRTDATKAYLTATLKDFWHAYTHLPKQCRCMYELLRESIPSRMYMDLDAKWAIEGFSDKNKWRIQKVQENLQSDMRMFFLEMVSSKEGGCDIITTKVIRKAIEFDVEDASLFEMFVSASSNERKFSWHVVFPNLVLLNTYHCGALMRRFEQWTLKRYGSTVESNPYFILADPESGQYDCIVDRGVYTPNRCWRLLWSSKMGQSRYFYPLTIGSDGSEVLNESLEYPVFLKSLIQRTVRLSCDPPGDILVHPGGPKFPVLFECCEARTPAELADLADSGLKWRDPISAGRRIWHLTESEMDSLNLNGYKKGKKRILTSSSSSSSSSSSRRFSSRARLSGRAQETIAMTMNRLVDKYGIGKDPRCDAIRIHLMQKVIKRARTIVSSLGAPKWWSSSTPPIFYERGEQSVDLLGGLVSVYPRDIRFCERQRSDHTSNHVTFTISCHAQDGQGAN